MMQFPRGQLESAAVGVFVVALKKRLSRECRFCPANVWTVVSRHYHPRQRVHKRLWTTKVQHWLVKSGPAYATLNFKVI